VQGCPAEHPGKAAKPGQALLTPHLARRWHTGLSTPTPSFGEPNVTDDPYHYPAELLNLLIDAIPRLMRSKLDVLDFFRSAGVPEPMTADLRRQVETDRNSINKFTIVRTVLNRLNAEGDRGLGPRREVVRRVCEFEEFSTCWPEDALKAKGLVADVRSVVNTKDSFTRMQQAQEKERQERLRQQREAAEALQRQRAEREALRLRLAGLSSMPDAHQRGIAFEGLLNGLFALDGMLVREAFTVKKDGEVVEQIDGLIELEGQAYLVEAKWWNKPLGPGVTAQHLVRVHNRAGVRGLYISNSGYTPAAIDQCAEALASRVVVLAETHELLLLLEQGGSIADWLKAKVYAAAVDRQPLFRPSLEPAAG
jgi:restriction system protein